MKLIVVKWSDNTISLCPDWLALKIKEKEPKTKLYRYSNKEDEKTYKIYANYKPVIFADTTNMNATINKELWLSFRRKGIGGSESAAAIGLGKWQTPYDIYMDKIGFKKRNHPNENWVALQHGHLLEPLINQIFIEKTGYDVYTTNKMFQHPFYDFLLADIDAFCVRPNGEIAIIENKTTNYNNHFDWKAGIIPTQYIQQGRHYMAVLNINRVYFNCYYGNSENEFLTYFIDRDYDEEYKMISQLENFWNNHVKRKVPPSYNQNAKLSLKSCKQWWNPVNRIGSNLKQLDCDAYLKLLEEKEALDHQINIIKEKIDLAKVDLITNMQNHEEAIAKDKNGNLYTITFKPYAPKFTISKNDKEKLRHQYPEIFKKFFTITQGDPIFKIKKKTKVFNKERTIA